MLQRQFEEQHLPEDALVALCAIRSCQPSWLEEDELWESPRDFLATRLLHGRSDRAIPHAGDHPGADWRGYKVPFMTVVRDIRAF
jgi:hypothetical protein